MNLYIALTNSSINKTDHLGLTPYETKWPVSGRIADGSIIQWNYQYSASLSGDTKDRAKCKLTYTATIQLIIHGDTNLGQIVFMTLGSWRNAISEAMNNWKLVSTDNACRCCSEIDIEFRVKFVGINNRGENVQINNKDYTVNIFPTADRSNMENWYFGDPSLSNNPYSTVVHEIGHIWGLKDEYLDGTFYPEKTVEDLPPNYDNSIMNDESKSFLPRYINEILYQIDNVQQHLPCASYELRMK